jgi:hypothetical protein
VFKNKDLRVALKVSSELGRGSGAGDPPQLADQTDLGYHRSVSGHSQAVGRSGFPRAALAQVSASGGGCLSARRACSRALMRFLAMRNDLVHHLIDLSTSGAMRAVSLQPNT